MSLKLHQVNWNFLIKVTVRGLEVLLGVAIIVMLLAIEKSRRSRSSIALSRDNDSG